MIAGTDSCLAAALPSACFPGLEHAAHRARLPFFPLLSPEDSAWLQGVLNMG
jgi:hypothetical protein